MHFQRTRTRNKAPLHLKHMYVYSSWQADYTIKLDAYDAVGVAGMLIEQNFPTDRLTVAPAALARRTAPPQCILLRPRDRAGNLAFPLYVPVFSTNQAVHPALEAELRRPVVPDDIDLVD